MSRLANKVAVITGGCSGIGRATAELFIAEGARVVVGDVQDDKGAALQQQYGDCVRYAHCDVTCESDIRALMDAATLAFGGLDILFNNAGSGGTKASIDEITAEDWDRAMAVLLRSAVLGIRHAAPKMRERGGCIINVSSTAAVRAGAGSVAYSVAKAGVRQLSSIAAVELGRYRIRVNSLCPGFVVTPIFTEGMDDARAESVTAYLRSIAPSRQPIPREGTIHDVARACLFLASDEASFVTGTELVVDGGLRLALK